MAELKKPNNTIDTQIEKEYAPKDRFSAGMYDGLTSALDPLGSIFSMITNIKTYGGCGMKSKTIADKNTVDDKSSMSYYAAKRFGVGLGIIANVLSLFSCQAATLVYDVAVYGQLKKMNRHKFQ
ncbi:MAG: hypothetical protein ABIC91_01005 [Nanoarchaeota archaeon]|nr:hypothetical protein [Nanoarchaeota archaeon]MBU1030926.1 hypothetical protein [Nanoarchaeota archaeon]MBU1850467.1 hypothetical protein [Nanoarchaeota archaeon]